VAERQPFYRIAMAPPTPIYRWADSSSGWATLLVKLDQTGRFRGNDLIGLTESTSSLGFETDFRGWFYSKMFCERDNLLLSLG
jgi:hypothetical protein